MMDEMISTYSRILIEQLLHVHALANMYRVSGREETRATAAGWLPRLEQNMADLKRALTEDQP